MVDATDLAVAVQYFLRSCELDTATACTDLGRLHARFEGVGLVRYQSAAWSLRGCELGDARGCLDLAYDFSKGEAGVYPSDTLATEYFERACELDRAACI